MALTVNGEKVEESLVTKEYQRLKPHYDSVFQDQSEQEQEKQLYEWSQENVIEMVLLRQYARDKVQAVPAAAVELAYKQMLEQYQTAKPKFDAEEEKKIKSDIELQMKIESLLREITAGVRKPSNEEIENYYEDNKEQFKIPESVRVSHIIKHVSYHVDEQAALSFIQQAQQQLKNGVIFSSVAAKYSDCPENGGDLGYVVKGQMVEEFEDVVFNLGIGETSNIFKTRFGFHIAKVYDRKPAVLPELSQVKDQVVQQVTEQLRKDTIDAFVDELKEKSVIEKN